jgi:hypothetical protein
LKVETSNICPFRIFSYSVPNSDHSDINICRSSFEGTTEEIKTKELALIHVWFHDIRS